MLLLAIVAITTLAANSARQLRYMAIAFFGVALAAHLIDDGSLAAAQVVVSATAALVASAILFIAARDRRYGRCSCSRGRSSSSGSCPARISR